jgi:hypothetical protein
MKTTTLILISTFILTGCAHNGPPNQVAYRDTNTAIPAQPLGETQRAASVGPMQDIKADSLVVSDNNGSEMLGALSFSLGQGGQFTGVPSSPIPIGPVIVCVFRQLPESEKEGFHSMGIDVHEGGAYLVDKWPPTKFKYLKDVDTKLSDDEFKELFHVAETTK